MVTFSVKHFGVYKWNSLRWIWPVADIRLLLLFYLKGLFGLGCQDIYPQLQAFVMPLNKQLS